MLQKNTTSESWLTCVNALGATSSIPGALVVRLWLLGAGWAHPRRPVVA